MLWLYLEGTVGQRANLDCMILQRNFKSVLYPAEVMVLLSVPDPRA